jgi:hypothetical protein
MDIARIRVTGSNTKAIVFLMFVEKNKLENRLVAGAGFEPTTFRG